MIMVFERKGGGNVEGKPENIFAKAKKLYAEL